MLVLLVTSEYNADLFITAAKYNLRNEYVVK